MRAQSHNRAYVLRYLEEVITETWAQIQFPVGDHYMVTVGDLKGEVRQVFSGPITFGGMTCQVWVASRPPIDRRK